MNDRSKGPKNPRQTSSGASLDLALLDAYLDGELEETQRDKVKEELQSPEGQQLLRRRQELLRKLADLPLEADLSSDLWPVLRARIAADAEEASSSADREELSAVSSQTQSNVIRSSFPAQERPLPEASGINGRIKLLAVAAALVLALGLGFRLGRSNIPLGTQGQATAAQDLSATTNGPTVASLANAQGASRHAMSEVEAALIAVKVQLRTSLERCRDTLPPETARSLDANLETIERSIVEVRRAIVSNPGSPELHRALVQYHESEIDLLQRMTRRASRL